MPRGSRTLSVDQEAEELVELYVRQGLTIREVATHLGVSNREVWLRLKDAGIPRRSVGVPGTVLDPVILRELYVRDGLSMTQVAARLGVGRSVVVRNLRVHDIARGERRRLSKEVLEELYLSQGLSAEAIAARAGVRREHVLADLRHWGLPRRHGGRVPKPLTREFAERVYRDLLRDVFEIEPDAPRSPQQRRSSGRSQSDSPVGAEPTWSGSPGSD